MEDCDDVMPLFEKNDEKVTEYELSLILEPSDPNFVSYVAEVDNKIVAFVQLTKNVDIQRLYESFTIEMFDCFRGCKRYS